LSGRGEVRRELGDVWYAEAGLFAALMVAMPMAISPHLITPAEYIRPVTVNLATQPASRASACGGSEPSDTSNRGPFGIEKKIFPNGPR
jgi:hypothetical protein